MDLVFIFFGWGILSLSVPLSNNSRNFDFGYKIDMTRTNKFCVAKRKEELLRSAKNYKSGRRQEVLWNLNKSKVSISDDLEEG